MRLYDKLHAADPGRVGIIASAGDDADFSGFDAVAVDAGRLSHPGHIQLSHAMKEEDAAALTGSIQEAGAKALFYVTGSASALKGDAAETAAILKEAVEDGGYDGLFLDLPRLGNASKSDLTALVRALRKALGERLLYVMAEAPAWQGTSYGGYDYAALGASADPAGTAGGRLSEGIRRLSHRASGPAGRGLLCAGRTEGYCFRRPSEPAGDHHCHRLGQ